MVMNMFSSGYYKQTNNGYIKNLPISKHFKIIQDYSDKFFDCKEKGFSYELGCRYQKIDFDFTPNIDAEINFLKGLLKIYKPEFVEEIKLIENLIRDLKAFKTHFEEYLKS